jgi:hypothetical protein
MSESGQVVIAEAVRGQMQRVETSPAQGAGVMPPRKLLRRLGGSLSDEQQRALGLVTQGISIREAGQQLGMHRGTIYRWLKTDPHFRAAYNAWQLEQQESCRAALMKAAEKAVVRVVEALSNDQKLAWQVIKELGIVSRAKPLTADPSRVEMEIALEDHEEESVLLRRIEKEVDKEHDLMSPRGDLARLLRLQHEAEQEAIRRSKLPDAQEGKTEAEPADGVGGNEVSRK